MIGKTKLTTAQYQERYYAKNNNREKKRIKDREYYAANKVKKSIDNAAYYAANRELIKIKRCLK
jgi:Tfp pilus assembly protein PilE